MSRQSGENKTRRREDNAASRGARTAVDCVRECPCKVVPRGRTTGALPRAARHWLHASARTRLGM